MTSSSDIVMNTVVDSLDAVSSSSWGDSGVAERVPSVNSGQHRVRVRRNVSLSVTKNTDDKLYH